MEEKTVKKYVKDMDGLLEKVKELGDEFTLLRIFPNEKMVIFLFGCLFRYFKFKGAIELGHEEKGDLDSYIYHEDNLQEPLITEFGAFSSNFKKHGHNEKRCNLIVCWKHDWGDCPSTIDVLELKHFGEKAKNADASEHHRAP